MKKIIRQVMSNLLFVKMEIKLFYIRNFLKNRKAVFFISTPLHGNLGDQAIVYAQYKLMRDIEIKKNIVEIPDFMYLSLKEKLEKKVKKEDIVIIDGGGNVGTLWIKEEEKMRDIIMRFSQNPIFIFPQTAFFEKSEWGSKQLQKTKEIYEKHSKLTIFCRDRQTYELFQTNLKKVKSIYTPDTVLYIDDIQKVRERNDILLCLRTDKEKIGFLDSSADLETQFTQKGYLLNKTSTVLNKRVFSWTRKRELDKKWKEFSSAKLVITDRLHGMIFCAITGTNCIALDNLSHKVSEGYEWIKYLPYVRFCENNEEEIRESLEILLCGNVNNKYDKKPLEEYYSKIKEEVKSAFTIGQIYLS